MTKIEERRMAPDDSPEGAERDELDEVGEASDGSFPASDPPSWCSMRVGPPTSREQNGVRFEGR